MYHGAVARLLRSQSGVVSRRQVHECGGNDNDIERLIRRREWARIHTGVYVEHTGPLTWDQRAWAAVLAHWPAALAGWSALRAHDLSPWPARVRDTDPIEVVVAGDRRVNAAAGVVVARANDYETIVQAHLSPPRMRVEHALLRLASRAHSDVDCVAVLADGCQAGGTTAGRLADRLRGMTRLPRRRLMLGILDDVALGVCSTLEHRYLVDVERPHGLPFPRRQRRLRSAGTSSVYRDVEYVGLRTVVELDGRLGHEWALDRWADLDRDVDSAVRDDITVRLGWKQVLEPCRAAAAMAVILIARGWDGRPKACAQGCLVADVGGSPPADAEDPPLSA